MHVCMLTLIHAMDMMHDGFEFFLFCILQGQTCTDVDEKSFGELEYNQEKHEKERRETILEIRDTEINYGRDLKILKEVCISCLFLFFLVKLLKIPNFYDMFNSL